MKLSHGLLAGLLALGLAACGNDRLERGLAPAPEQAAPNSTAEDEDSQAQRRQQMEQEVERREQQEMNQSEQQEQQDQQPPG